jgi:serpin B
MRKEMVMSISGIVFMTCALVLARGVWAEGGVVGDEGEKKDMAEVVKGGNAFGVEMYGELAGKVKGNLFFSPGSIETALAMTYAGAGGETAKQMAKALHFDLPAERLHPAFAAVLDQLNHPAQLTEYWRDAAGGVKPEPVSAYQLVVANALWGQKGYPFKAEFTGLVARSYGGAMNELDFAHSEAARVAINEWVGRLTNDKIKDLIGPNVLTPQTTLVLTNAVYFKSDWDHKFGKSATQDGAFKVSAEKSVDVPMMHQTGHFAYMENDLVQGVELPYKVGALSMVILLPRKAEGLGAVEKNLTAENLGTWLKALQGARVDMTMPRWKFSSEMSLRGVLEAMGMTDAFDAQKADFSGMASHEKLFISAVIHKAFVAVDEEGTEAAAATAVAMAASAVMRPAEPKVVKADHPFVFLIRHNATGEILFMGRVANPKE